jgi:transposase InsO family protein
MNLKDSWGKRREFTQLFYGVDWDATAIIISNPGLAREGIVLDPRNNKWRFGLEDTDLSVVKWKRFHKGRRSHVGAFMALPILMLQVASVAATGETTAFILPPEFQDFEGVFSVEEAGKLASHYTTDHAIDIGDQTPPYGPLYNLSARELEVLRRYLVEAEAKGWIRPSTSPAGAPVLFVPKKDGGLRLCVDYRGLNKITRKNRYPLPLISETLDRLSGAKIFTKLDLKDAYHRIRIREGDEWKTAFRTRYGHFEYLVMPFGLTNAPATFQSYINQALSGLVDIFCVVYLDDILIYSQTREEHTLHVRRVLERLKKWSLYANPKKCVFYTDRVEFLGFIVSREGVAMDPSRVSAISEWPIPKSYHDVQVFLGFANFYRRFIENYSKLAGPLTSLLKGSKKGRKTGPFEWTDNAQHAFHCLRTAFTTAPILRHFEPELPIRVETDASKFAAAAILSQLHDPGNWHPVAFWSRKLTSAEAGYPTYDQELLAIVFAFKHWRHYLEASATPVEVLTDHNNLQGFMGVKELSGRQSRWALYLAAFDFYIKHRAGKLNPADAPSRRPDYAEAEVAVNNMLPTLQKKLGLTEAPLRAVIGAVRDLQLSCWHLRPLRLRNPQTQGSILSGEGEMPSPQCRGVTPFVFNPAAGTAGREQLVPRSVACAATQSETAYDPPSSSLVLLLRVCQSHDEEGKKRRLAMRENAERGDRAGATEAWSEDSEGLLRYNGRAYVPAEESVRKELLRRHHDDGMAGHLGVKKTQGLLERKFYWPGLPLDVKRYVKTCGVCQRNKAPRHRPYGELQSLPVPAGPWQELTMDFIVGLPPSKRYGGVYDAILVVVDRYTKMSRYIPTTKDVTAVRMADLLFDEAFCRYGVPKGIVSDRARIITGEYWGEICYQLKIKRRLSTAFHPQTDGQTERQNQTLEQYLRNFCTKEQDNWAGLLPLAEFAYNNAPHASTKQSPFYSLYGYHPALNCDITEREQSVPAAIERVKHFQQIRGELENHLHHASETQAKAYNQKHTPKNFSVGDLVLVSTKNWKLAVPNRKLAAKFAGPFRVIEPIGTQAYRLQLPSITKVHNVFHVSLLEPYYGRGKDESSSLPLPELANGEPEWEVEEILDERIRKGNTQFLVKWVGFPSDYNQWLPKEDLENAPERVQTFQRNKTYKKKKQRKKRELADYKNT